ncbi:MULTISPECIES: type IV toxin-antitoxin system YeeU family antitoxin [Rahnella]|uniref:Type IV toxin-antitoxin system YeeU family antitoxin n=1 Tax=Rahnella laticis TaxID=2787622 RepID=A0ABS0E2Z7_9GAMM|nr:MULTISPECIES: type IV toxin-antitoxin system YeeU family antitoxin [Rahnella]MBF7979221.1 type IV toxin-antitoxin system YeeU family antitoxin [Rahnella laticis]MBF7999514.1 type IV toxin-antitoxin system YeeU family antitoxin [Rahnella sp. LAC-M12]
MTLLLPSVTQPTVVPVSPHWGLRNDISPCFSARLVQESSRLHYLADRAGFCGEFSADAALRLDQAFPLIHKQLERTLVSGGLEPRHQQRVTLHHNGLTCDADTLGSHGYVYLSVYPTPSAAT